jgi:diguanylate cyclase (GGDEF)-like protein
MEGLGRSQTTQPLLYWSQVNLTTPTHHPLCQGALFPLEVADSVRVIDPTHLPTTIRKRTGFTGFTPTLEHLFNRFYETRFRSWLRAGLALMAIYYICRWYALFLEAPTHPLHWAIGTLTTSWLFLCLLTYTPLSFRLLQWLTVPALMLMLWSIVALNHPVWQNGNDQIGAAQVVSPFVIGLGLFRFPLRMGVIALSILLITLIASYLGFGIPLFPQAAWLIGITVLVLVLFYTTLEREARLDFITRLTLYHLATTDGLTGIANRAYFLEQLRRMLANGERVALMLFDVDNFKSVNDTYGHAAGDTALRTIGTILSEAAGQSGLAGRLGGEEFAVILPCSTVKGANSLAEAIAAKVRTTLIPYSHGSFRVTLSGGVAISTPPHLVSVDKLLHSADRLMYQAKHAGRNRVMHG